MMNNVFQYLKGARMTFAATFNLQDPLRKVENFNPFCCFVNKLTSKHIGK